MSRVTEGTRRLLFGVAGLGLLMCAAACQEKPTPPNILVLVVDTLRADNLGVYGFDGPVSPNLDRFAQESIVFENCFSQAPWTKPSVASLFTSLYPQVHGVINYDGNYAGTVKPELQTRTGILPERAETLAEALQQGGYQTAAFVSNIWLLNTYGYAQGFEFYYDKPASTRMTRAGTLIDGAEIWLSARSADRPFFLYMHFMDVHAPYGVTSRVDYESLLGAVSKGAPRRLTDREVPYAVTRNTETRPNWATDEMRHQLAYWRARYASGVQAFDRRLESLLGFLREGGYLDNTLVVLTADHGEELFDHEGWSHGATLHDHQVHVPLIVRNPMGRNGGRRVTNTSQLIDLMPTLLTVSGAPAPSDMQGRDLSGLLQADRAEEPVAVFATASKSAPGYHSVRFQGYKLIVNIYTHDAWLYDLQSDPAEQHDIIAEQPDRAAQLRARLDDHLSSSMARGALDAEHEEVSDDMLENLRALGYLGDAQPTEAERGNEATEPSIDAMLEALRRQPTSDGYINLSLAYFEQEEWSRCIEACERALELDPRSALAFNNMCVAYGMTQQWKKAVVAGEQAVAIDPGFVLARNNLAWVRSERDDG
jgi:arylsulfatase A-like enzyme